MDPYRTLSFYCLRNPAIRQDETFRSKRQRPCLRPAFARGRVESRVEMRARCSSQRLRRIPRHVVVPGALSPAERACVASTTMITSLPTFRFNVFSGTRGALVPSVTPMVFRSLCTTERLAHHTVEERGGTIVATHILTRADATDGGTSGTGGDEWLRGCAHRGTE